MKVHALKFWLQKLRTWAIFIQNWHGDDYLNTFRFFVLFGRKSTHVEINEVGSTLKDRSLSTELVNTG